MQNAKRVGTLPLVCKWLWISLQLSHSLQQVSPLLFVTCINPSLVYRRNCYFNEGFMQNKKSRYLVIICKWLWISLQLLFTAAGKPLIISDFCTNPFLMYRQNRSFTGKDLCKTKKSRYLVVILQLSMNHINIQSSNLTYSQLDVMCISSDIDLQ